MGPTWSSEQADRGDERHEKGAEVNQQMRASTGSGCHGSHSPVRGLCVPVGVPDASCSCLVNYREAIHQTGDFLHMEPS